MKLARVVKKVVSTIKHRVFAGRPLLLVQPIDLQLAGVGREVLAIDLVHAAIGEVVLLLEEGSSCQQLLADKQAPVDSAVVAIVDEVVLADGRRVFDKAAGEPAPAAPKPSRRKK